MARSVADVALMYGALVQSTPTTFTAPPSLAAAQNWRTGHPKTDALFDDLVKAFKSSGLSVDVRDIPVPGETEERDELTVLLSELVDDLGAYLADRPGDGMRSLADVIAYEDEHRDVEQVWFGHEHFLEAIETGGRSGPHYAEARRRNLAWAIETCLTPGIEGADVIIAPAYGPSWKSDLTVGGHPGPASPATTPAAIAGWPILSLPMGIVDDLPVGLAVVGRPGSEWMMLDTASRLEKIIHAESPLPQPFWAAPSRG
jgi:amidase